MRFFRKVSFHHFIKESAAFTWKGIAEAKTSVFFGDHPLRFSAFFSDSYPTYRIFQLAWLPVLSIEWRRRGIKEAGYALCAISLLQFSEKPSYDEIACISLHLLLPLSIHIVAICVCFEGYRFCFKGITYIAWAFSMCILHLSLSVTFPHVELQQKESTIWSKSLKFRQIFHQRDFTDVGHDSELHTFSKQISLQLSLYNSTYAFHCEANISYYLRWWRRFLSHLMTRPSSSP